MFRLFADMIGFHLDAHRKVAASETSLTDERQSSKLREEFIAVLGHDLRSPLASIGAGAALLAKQPLNERSIDIVGHMQKSVVRMSDLIDDVLDLARGRLGGGIMIEKGLVAIEAQVNLVVDELRAAWPRREILTEVNLPETVRCDPSRIGQLLSDLLANAVTHGSETLPILVQAKTADGTFHLSVTNRGDAIPAHVAQNLLKPFVRVTSKPSQQGLGLGLYIASEIARAHGGSLTVSSDDTATCFTFRMPIGRQA